MKPTKVNHRRDILATAQALRWEVGEGFHEKLMETLYTNATEIADRAVTRPGEKPRFDLDRTIDRIVTSRRWGFLLMILLFTLVFWITISLANVPSRWISELLIGTIYPLLNNAAASIGMPWWMQVSPAPVKAIEVWPLKKLRGRVQDAQSGS